ncbi:hypothetical protein QO058_18965 [Bosea vestrisii]|uniref:ABC-three component system protein n=1 Tax=Bosea vestrisii TaxID=151416 RepID=UPI0024DF7240|nr:ABC-three component system protein [Bosea vestrisii]WID94890.1 hypothetical protein QO058_18965 [Bosea vestrisii]
MTSHQRMQWQTSLELRLRRVHGDSFQEFFADVMERLHGTDFLPARAMGSLGDKGCDGYLRGSGQVFQCYGKRHDTPLNTTTVVNKIKDDYATAASKLPAIMKEWHFVHNLFDGIPVDVIELIEALGRQHSDHRFGLIGPASFSDRVLGLPENDLVFLLGPVASSEESMNMRVEEVATLMAGVIKGMDETPFADARPNQPPVNKLELNRIEGHWRRILIGAGGNASVVASYVDQHPDPELGKRVAKVFSRRYAELDTENLPPYAILTTLYEDITGIGSVPPERQVAAQALLAYLFEACDIFKDDPSKAAA